MSRAGVILVAALGTMLAVIGLTVGVALAHPPESGVPVGEMLLSIRPRHVSGPDRGTNVCPLCQYPDNPAVQVWVNGDDERNVAAIAAALDAQVGEKPAARLKAFVVYANAARQPDDQLLARLEPVAARSGLKRVAFVFITSGDLVAVRDNSINVDPAVRNTVFVYKQRKVAAKFVNLTADSRGLAALRAAVSAIVR
jgi:protocatechuate 3,4-dioxygenase beta subunit